MSEEEEICKLKKDIIRKIRDNEELENGLSSMDVKIGLLIKNRISLEEAELHLRWAIDKRKPFFSNPGKLIPFFQIFDFRGMS